MGVQMLVSDYLDQVIKSRPYKYSTKQSLIRDVKRLGIAGFSNGKNFDGFLLMFLLSHRPLTYWGAG
jgi:hypothetical protein